jgi:hypothetical protein
MDRNSPPIRLLTPSAPKPGNLGCRYYSVHRGTRGENNSYCFPPDNVEKIAIDMTNMLRGGKNNQKRVRRPGHSTN